MKKHDILTCPHMSMKHDSAGMRMWEGLRERYAQSNPECYNMEWCYMESHHIREGERT